MSLEVVGQIADPANHPHLSVASLWEIAIKVQLGKLRLHVPFQEVVRDVYSQNRLRVLNIESGDLCRLLTLPLLHRDPFDRIIVAQALERDLTVIGRDAVMDGYGVRRIF